MSLKSKFCAKCGKAGTSLCHDCFLDMHPIKIPSKTSIRYCTKCNSVWLGGLWIKAAKPIEKYLLRKVIDKIKLPEGAEVIKAEILKTGALGKLKITLKLGNSKLVEEYNTQLIIEKFCCPPCSREKSSTYLAKLQLRTDKNVIEFIKKTSKIVREKGRYVTKAEEQTQGIDFYISSKDVATSLANKIKKELKCRMKKSTRQHGWDRMRNKPLTKLTILLKTR